MVGLPYNCNNGNNSMNNIINMNIIVIIISITPIAIPTLTGYMVNT